MIGSVLGRLVWPGCRDESSIYRSSGVADTGVSYRKMRGMPRDRKTLLRLPFPKWNWVVRCYCYGANAPIRSRSAALQEAKKK